MSGELSNILYPALALGAIGLFFGALLAFSSIVFKVEKDEREDLIAEALPGANCGGCGYAGCAALAKAIVCDGVRPTRCNLMTEETAKKISKIMGIDAKLPTKKVARLACSGCTEKCANKYGFDGIDDCFTAMQLAGGPKNCEYGCMGIGSCVDACMFGAISIKDGISCIDEEKCTGCGRCASVCPKHLIQVVPYTSKVFVACSSKDKGAEVKNYCIAGCIGCKLCEKKCAAGAITVTDNVAKINAELCTSCGECAAACPKKVIKTM